MEEEQIILSPREIFRITIVGDHKSGKTTFIKNNFMMDHFKNKNKNNYSHKMYIPGFEETNEWLTITVQSQTEMAFEMGVSLISLKSLFSQLFLNRHLAAA